MGTRKISQLETISDGNLSGEAILPVVVSDPLLPNRKVKINQLFKGVSQGSKDEPGLCLTWIEILVYIKMHIINSASLLGMVDST